MRFKTIIKYSTCLFLTPLLTHNVSNGQYCMPSYTNGGCTGTTNIYDINNFRLSGNGGHAIIDAATGCSPNSYADRTMAFPPLELIQGQIYYGTLSSRANQGKAKIWIDFNNDYIFQLPDSVTMATITAALANTDYNYKIKIPLTADTGLHRMRVRHVRPTSGMGYYVVDPCNQVGYGEVHDYTVRILKALPDDLGITLITKPVVNAPFCSREPLEVKAVVSNMGLNAQAGFDVQARYESGAVNGTMQMTYPGTLMPQTVDTLSLGYFTPPVGGNYQLKVYPILAGDQRNSNDTSYLQVYIDGKPVPLPNDTTICEDQFPYVLDAGNPTCVHLWNTGELSQSIQVTSPNIFSIKMISPLGCTVTDTIVILSSSLPSVSGIAINGSGKTFSMSAGAPQHVTDYYWDFGDGETNNTANPTHTYATGGTYPITLVVYNDCGTDTARFNIMVFALSLTGPKSRAEDILVYPNPATDILNIQIPDELLAAEIVITDHAGRIVLSYKPERSASRLPLSNLSTGSYLLVLRSSSGNRYKMFQIRK